MACIAGRSIVDLGDQPYRLINPLRQCFYVYEEAVSPALDDAQFELNINRALAGNADTANEWCQTDVRQRDIERGVQPTAKRLSRW